MLILFQLLLCKAEMTKKMITSLTTMTSEFDDCSLSFACLFGIILIFLMSHAQHYNFMLSDISIDEYTKEEDDGGDDDDFDDGGFDYGD